LKKTKITHERVRFSKKDRQNLDRLPSANNVHSVKGRFRRILHGFAQLFGWAAVSAFALGILAVGWLALFGISSQQFTRSAEGLIRSIAGPEVETKLESARLALDSSGNLAFQGTNLSLQSIDGSGRSGAISDIRIGLGTWSLLTGRTEIVHLEINGADISVAGSGGFADLIKLPDGRYSPALVPRALANIVTSLTNELEKRKTGTISLSNVRFSTRNGSTALPSIRSMDVARLENGDFSWSGLVMFAGIDRPVSGKTDGKSQYSTEIGNLSIGVAEPEGTMPEGRFKHGAAGHLTITGSLGTGALKTVAGLRVEEFAWTSRRDIRYGGTASLGLEMIEGIDKVEIMPSSIVMGANRFAFSGALGLAGADVQDNRAYRFEIVSNESRLQPSDSPENGIDAAFRISGDVSSDLKSVRFSEMAARTLGGDIFGSGTMRFSAGSPEMIFGLRIPSFKVADAKQFWPGMIAYSARKWVLDHVYGGTITDSRIDLTIGPGRLDSQPDGTLPPPLTEDELSAQFNINSSRFDIVGTLPPVRDASGQVNVRGLDTDISIEEGIAYLEDGKSVRIESGQMAIPFKPGKPVVAALDLIVDGPLGSIADIANREPFNAMSKAPVTPDELKGDGRATVKASFPFRRGPDAPKTIWSASVDFNGMSIDRKFNGQQLTEAKGSLTVNQTVASLEASGKLNGLPADIKVTEPVNGSGNRSVSATLRLDDKARAQIAPGLKDIVKGIVNIDVKGAADGSQAISADLEKATINLPWAGWTKGSGVAATADMRIKQDGGTIAISDFELKGGTFRMAGNMTVAGNTLTMANFSSVRLNRGDEASVAVVRGKGGYDVTVDAKSLDLRGLLKRVLSNFESAAAATGGETVRLKASIGSATGFGSQSLLGVQATYVGKGNRILSFEASATTENGGKIAIENSYKDGRKNVLISATDGGAMLRFLDIYDKMRGGSISVVLAENGNGVLGGEVDASNFTIVGEPRLKSLVGTPVTPDGQSVAKAGKIDVSAVKFQRGSALVQKGNGFLRLGKGILRSDQMGLSYDGTLYDQKGRISMTGTFLPAYGLNRIFGEIPLIGEILGNGRDKGLIGITFKLSGAAKSPELVVNPISLVAPGIFRQIFEFQ
jgi:hypothetical protein